MHLFFSLKQKSILIKHGKATNPWSANIFNHIIGNKIEIEYQLSDEQMRETIQKCGKKKITLSMAAKSQLQYDCKD